MDSIRTAIKVIAFSVALTGLSGFTLKPSLVPSPEIMSGGPGKDGIPALTNPEMESADAASHWLRPADELIGIEISGQARAYPLRILNWHEIVNDHIGGRHFVITYCPLCGSGMAFDSADTFGVSGLLYQSDVLLYDRKTESLWSQLMAQAISGPRMGEKLKMLHIEHTSWQDWRQRHPQSQVMSMDTGYYRDYSYDPYTSYRLTNRTMFPVSHDDDRLPGKAWVMGLNLNGRARAWEISALQKAGERRETWHGKKLIVRYHNAGNRAEVIDAVSGKPLPTVALYWFAWAAFHPDTELYHR